MKTPALFKNLYNLEKQPPRSRDFNMDEFRDFLEQFDNPHRSIGKVIHIAGTNGKGSLAHILRQILTDAGFKTGLFTSPHIKEINERVSVDGVNISDDDFRDIEEKVYEKIQGREKSYRTFFEAITTLAFLYFKDQSTDYAILETGLGGRLDSTNVCRPDITAITKIDKDHMHILGDSIEEIAQEKAGIIKEDIPLFTIKQNPKVIAVLKERCNEKNAPFFMTNPDDIMSVSNTGFTYKGVNYQINQPGVFQKVNACLAVDITNHINIEREIIRKGVRQFAIKGRLDIVSDNPPVIIDGAHNPSAIETALKEVKNLYPDREISIIAGFMADKDFSKSIKVFREYSDDIMLIKIDFFRAAGENELSGIDGARYMGSMENAVKEFNKKKAADKLLLITGSFYLLEEGEEAVKNIII